MPNSFTALILAGRRDGFIDPLAAAHNVEDKCLVPLAGRPLIAHVLSAVASVSDIGTIIVSTNDPALIANQDWGDDTIDPERLRVVQAQRNLADSIVAALEDAHFPVLVTTADNVLLTPNAISHFAAEAMRQAADAAVAMARQDDVLAAHPNGQRRFYQFADAGYSNCNCYWIGSPDALKAVEAFRGGGQFAKKPRRIIDAFGLVNLIRFALRMSTLEGCFAAISRRFGLRIVPVRQSDGSLAIDVDNERTHKVAETLYLCRQ